MLLIDISRNDILSRVLDELEIIKRKVYYNVIHKKYTSLFIPLLFFIFIYKNLKLIIIFISNMVMI